MLFRHDLVPLVRNYTSKSETGENKRFCIFGCKILKMAVRSYVLFLILPVCIAFACNGPGEKKQDISKGQELLGVQSLIWYQRAAETEALYLQGYNIATDRLRAYRSDGQSTPPAVVLDIDETVLDNSPFNVELLRKGESYSEEKWANWCEMRAALPLPGALGFTKLADSLGIEVYYVSNRSIEVLDATLENLRIHGFPNADEEHVLLKTTTSSKDMRRAAIRETHEIILLLGDNLGDFKGVFDDRAEQFGKTMVGQYREEFGRKFIVFPNPVYGGWVRAAFPDGMPSEQEVPERLRGYGQ